MTVQPPLSRSHTSLERRLGGVGSGKADAGLEPAGVRSERGATQLRFKFPGLVASPEADAGARSERGYSLR